MTSRTATVERTTAETAVVVALNVDGAGSARIETGIGYLDHMLATLTRHARFDLELGCRGDLQVDDHHSVEDTAIALGQALDRALGERRSIARFGSAYAPLDEALVRAVVDISGRPFAAVDLGLRRERLGELSAENLPHFFRSFATGAGLTLHLDLIRGENDHHRAEAAFKALALALRQAVSTTPYDDVPSTKGSLREAAS